MRACQNFDLVIIRSPPLGSVVLCFTRFSGYPDTGLLHLGHINVTCIAANHRIPQSRAKGFFWSQAHATHRAAVSGRSRAASPHVVAVLGGWTSMYVPQCRANVTMLSCVLLHRLPRKVPCPTLLLCLHVTSKASPSGLALALSIKRS